MEMLPKIITRIDSLSDQSGASVTAGTASGREQLHYRGDEGPLQSLRLGGLTALQHSGKAVRESL